MSTVSEVEQVGVGVRREKGGDQQVAPQLIGVGSGRNKEGQEEACL